MTYLPRDFIETTEGLVFSVVDDRTEDGRVLCCLRYLREQGKFRKLGTADAGAYLSVHAPEYLFHSRRLDTRLHGVPIARIVRHYRPRERGRELLAGYPRDAIEEKCGRWLRLFIARGLDADRVGITGSLLIGAQTSRSDLDFVLYGRKFFFQARNLVRDLIDSGALEGLDAAAWREAYQRRGCALGFEDYLWHERRKFNKGLIGGTKFDITLVGEDLPLETGPVRKLGATVVRAEVADAVFAYDHPALYRLAHPEIREAISYTHSYAGQAEAGETVEIAGMLEATASGRRRIVVGSSREAPGEYIKVVSRRNHASGDTMTGSARSGLTLPPFRAAILDMDGLVLDSEATYVHAWRRTAAEFGVELKEDFCHGLFGRHADDVEQAMRAVLGNSYDRERFYWSAERHWRAHLDVHGLARMPGLEPLLRVFRRRAIPYALATNSDGVHARECLRRSDLEREFPALVTRDQVRRGKPEPDLFLEAARRLGVPPEACLALEDSETGLTAARAAGTITVLVQPREATRLRVKDHAEFTFSSLGEVAEAIEASPGGLLAMPAQRQP